MTFLSDSDELMQRFALTLDPVFHGPPAHIHPTATERFTVDEGTLALRRGATWRDLGPGDSVTVPPGTVHTYANTSGEPVNLTVELTSGRDMRGFFEALYDLAEQGLLTKSGGLRLTQAARLFRRYPNALTLATPPPALQWPMWWAIALFDRDAKPHPARP